ncbi:hypothetical protein [Spirosoma litoris]
MVVLILLDNNHQTTKHGMERGENFNKLGLSKPAKGGIRRFLEQRFDWIALLAITLLILLILVVF